MDEFYGLGPLEPLLADPLVSDVLVNSPSEVYVERDGRLEASDVVFADEAHLLRIIQRVVGRSGRRIDEASATVDTRLPDGRASTRWCGRCRWGGRSSRSGVSGRSRWASRRCSRAARSPRKWPRF